MKLHEMKKIMLLVTFSLALAFCTVRGAAPPTTSPPGYEKDVLQKAVPSFGVSVNVFMAVNQPVIQATETIKVDQPAERSEITITTGIAAKEVTGSYQDHRRREPAMITNAMERPPALTQRE